MRDRTGAREPAGQGSRVKGQGYQQLLAWQRAHDLALAVFRATASFSSANGWLRSQVNRSAVSVPANIAEGYSRGSLREYIQFLNIARGSLAETEYYLLFAQEAGLLTPEASEEMGARQLEAGRLLLGLIRSLRDQDASGAREPRRIGEEAIAYAVSGRDPSGLDPRPMTLDPEELP